MASASSTNDDDDYMSNDILSKCGDNRPGLMSKETARRYNRNKRIKQLNVKNRMKPRIQLEIESRRQALQTALPKDNKGFAMLQRMGYKPGMSLGRSGQEGRKEPVPIVLKMSRSGLGHDKEVQRKRQVAQVTRSVTIQKRQKVQKIQVEDYQSRKRNELLEKLAEKDLYSSQKVCHQLDEQKGLLEPSESFFWPVLATSPEDPEAKDDGEDDDSGDKDDIDNSLTATNKLEILTLYLHDKYFYCVWCGTKYNDVEDLQQNCPGKTRQDHDE